GGDRTVHVDAAAGVLDDDRLETLAMGVLGRVAYAKIERQPGKEDAPQAAFAQITGEPGRRRAVVLIKRRIGIDRASKALADDEGGMRNLQVVAKRGAGGFLHAMIGPEHLKPVSGFDCLKRLLSRMRRCKRQVPGRMPVLGEHDVGELAGDTVDDRHDLVPARHGEAAARAKILLHVDHEENVPLGGRYGVGHDPPPDFARRWSTSAARRLSASTTVTS